jgi:methylenetetrahydrofolate reductase (NADPH)
MATLRDKLAQGDFVITAEIVPPLSASAKALLDRAEPLRGLVDAINVTDAAGARPAMSSFAAAAILKTNGFEPILQITCRDRNRIALVGDLLGAAAQGVENLLILHGDDPKIGDMPEAKPVYDLNAREVTALAQSMRDEAKLPSGRDIKPPPAFYIGCADTPIDPPAEWWPVGLEGKVAAGAQFAQMQFCFDAELAKRYFERLDASGITNKLKFIAGTGPLSGAKQAHFMRQNLFGVSIPDAIIHRLEGTSDPLAEGQAICADIIGALSTTKGLSGVHLMVPAQSSQALAAAIRKSGLR